MGTWGYESYSNDGCYDAMADISDIHAITSKQADRCLTKLLPTLRESYEGFKQDFVGVALWALHHECKVKPKMLTRAIELAKELLKSDHASEWDDPTKRKEHLKQEIAEFEAAIANNGQGVGKRVPGLLEKIMTGQKS